MHLRAPVLLVVGATLELKSIPGWGVFALCLFAQLHVASIYVLGFCGLWSSGDILGQSPRSTVVGEQYEETRLKRPAQWSYYVHFTSLLVCFLVSSRKCFERFFRYFKHCKLCLSEMGGTVLQFFLNSMTLPDPKLHLSCSGYNYDVLLLDFDGYPFARVLRFLPRPSPRHTRGRIRATLLAAAIAWVVTEGIDIRTRSSCRALYWISDPVGS